MGNLVGVVGPGYHKVERLHADFIAFKCVQCGREEHGADAAELLLSKTCEASWET